MRLTGRTASALVTTVAGLALSWLLLSLFSGSSGVRGALDQIVSRVSGADPGYLAGAFALFILSQVLRAFRWMVLSFGRRMPFSLSMPVTSVHVGLAHLLPVRLADVAFVALLRHLGAVPVGYGTATVIHAKLLDLVAMGLVIGTAVAAGIGEAALAAPILAVVGCAGILFLAPLLTAIRRPVEWTYRRITGKEGFRWYGDLVQASSISGRLGRISSAFLISVAVWMSKLSMFCLLLASMGITGIPVWKVFFASGITDLTMALPVHGLFSLGAVEAGWAAGFAMVGVEGIVSSGTSVVELGFSVHLLWLVMAVVLMLAALPWLVLKGRRLRSDPKGGDVRSE